MTEHDHENDSCVCRHFRKFHGHDGCAAVAPPSGAPRDSRCSCRKFELSVTVDGHGPGRETAEKVDHPAHYGGANNVYEPIKIIRAWKLGFSVGNAIKYILRAGRKGGETTLDDLRKARWYIDEEIAYLETESKK